MSTLRRHGCYAPDGAALPNEIAGTRVQVNGLDAAVSYVKPAQVNFLVPDHANLGDGVVQVFTAAGASRALPVRIDDAQPVLFNDGHYAIAQHADYSLVNAASPARPGETIILWGSGFGPTSPPVITSVLLAAPAPLADPGGLRLTIGGQTAPVAYAGMTLAGVYQINVTVPVLATGDHAIGVTLPGRQSALTVYVRCANSGRYAIKVGGAIV